MLYSMMSVGYAGGGMLKVAVIDTGLDLSDPRFSKVLCADGHKDFTGTGIKDVHGHGTHVAGLIKTYAAESKGYCLVILKYWVDGMPAGQSNIKTVEAIREATRIGARIINYSSNGKEFSEPEYLAIRAFSGAFVVAAGNEGEDLDLSPNYPASYRLLSMIVVGALGENGKRLRSSNYGTPVTTWETGENVLSYLPGGKSGFMSGTSMATGVATGKLIKKLRLPQK